MKWRILFILSVAELLGMVLWFSASAVTPVLTTEWQLDDAGQAWLTMSVQIGFVVGAFLSTLLNLSDIFNARHLFTICALLGAIFNGAIGMFVDSLMPALVLRFLTGVCLAGIYPPGMKIMATWFKESRGLAIGILVAALTIGSACPHLLKVLGSLNWRNLMLMASVSSVFAGTLGLVFIKDGPHQAQSAKFDWRFIGRAFGDRGVRLANFGYLGHMWELYAVWTWIPIFFLASYEASGLANAKMWASISAFVVIAVGGIGCVIAGFFADRYGRTTVTIVSMLISGSCCIAAGFLYGSSPIALLILCVIWGLTIVADSAQFSTSITELAEPEYVGTALTLQTCLGFLLTLVSIRLVPIFENWLTWRWAFAMLTIGPIFGSLSMYRLKRSLVAAKIGGESGRKRQLDRL